MEIQNSKRWAPPGAKPYLAAFIGFLAAFALRYSMHSLLDDHLPMLLFALNCIVIAFLYGFYPSLFALALSLPTALVFFVKPFDTLEMPSGNDLFILTVYTTLISVAAFFMEWVRREQYKAVLLARVSDSRYRLLVEADEDRRAAARRDPSRGTGDA